MRTERLFYKDSHQTTCQAKVLECREVKKGYEILLDQTVFYPEGGGQPCDIGTMNQVEVTDVQEKDGEIWHWTREAIPEGTEVNCKIDWERRFDLMQQHSGEHLISGLIHEKYGYNNVGFHMGSETITLDVDGEVPEAVLKEIEAKANQYVWENHPVEITYPSEEERKTLPYRSKKELTGDVRIVTWPGMDICACCGVHVDFSGEIGQITLVSAQKFKGGMRIEMLCGKPGIGVYQSVKRTEPKDFPAVVRKMERYRRCSGKITERISAVKVPHGRNGTEKDRDDRSTDRRMRRSAVVRGRYVTGQRKKAGFGCDGKLWRPLRSV